MASQSMSIREMENHSYSSCGSVLKCKMLPHFGSGTKSFPLCIRLGRICVFAANNLLQKMRIVIPTLVCLQRIGQKAEEVLLASGTRNRTFDPRQKYFMIATFFTLIGQNVRIYVFYIKKLSTRVSNEAGFLQFLTKLITTLIFINHQMLLTLKKRHFNKM